MADQMPSGSEPFVYGAQLVGDQAHSKCVRQGDHRPVAERDPQRWADALEPGLELLEAIALDGPVRQLERRIRLHHVPAQGRCEMGAGQ